MIVQLAQIENLPESSLSIDLIRKSIVYFLDGNNFSIFLLNGSPHDTVGAFSYLKMIIINCGLPKQ